MDPVSLQRQTVLPTTTDRLEGRVETVDSKKGVVVVRLPGGEAVEAGGAGLAEGEKVALQKGADGAWIARAASPPRVALTASPTVLLASLLSLDGGKVLDQAVKSGDVPRIRSAMSQIASEIASRPAADLADVLLPAKSRGLAPLANVGERGDAATGSGAVPLVLLEETAEGLYRAEAAGRSVALVGASGLPTGPVGLWTESIVNTLVSIWMPVDLDASEVPVLPSRITADETGARRLLDRLGVQVPEATDPSFKALVRVLARAAGMPPHPAAAASRAGGGLPAATTSGLANPSDPSASPLTGTSVAKQVAAPPIPSGSAGGATTGATAAVVPPGLPADVGQILSSGAEPVDHDPEIASAKADRGGAQPGQEEAAHVEPARNAASSTTRSAPVPLPLPLGAEPSEIPARPGTSAAVAPGPVSAAADGKEGAAPVADAPRTLSAAAALRVVCAWALSEDEPSAAVLSAAIGDVEDLPEALHRLAEHAARSPASFPEVAAFLVESDPELPLMPHRMGLEKGRAAPSTEHADDSRPLSSAAVGDLALAIRQGRSEDAQVLREALRSLVGEGLDGAKDPSNPMASTPWTMPPRGERPDAGRLVVRDRRRDREGRQERTVVDVTMNPSGLGTVGARLEAVGKELEVRFRASEPATAERIRDALPELRQILTGLGYGTRELDVEGGRPVVPPAEQRRPGSAGLLDLRA